MANWLSRLLGGTNEQRDTSSDGGKNDAGRADTLKTLEGLSGNLKSKGQIRFGGGGKKGKK